MISAIKDYHKAHPVTTPLLLLFMLLLFLGSIGAVYLVHDEQTALILSDLISLIFNLFATSALVLATVHSMRISKRVALSWAILASAQLIYLIGDLLWAYTELVLHQSPFPSVADAAYIAYYPIFFLGVLLHPRIRLNRTNWWKRALDLGMVILATILGFYVFLISPILGGSSGAPWLERLLSLAYPVGDLLQVFVLFLLLFYFDERQLIGPIGILATGILVMVISDSTFSYQALRGTYHGNSLVDLGWLVGYSFIAAAGWSQYISVAYGWPGAVSLTSSREFKKAISQVFEYLPYIWVVGSFVLLVKYHAEAAWINTDVLFMGVGFIIALVIFRQVISLHENRQLMVGLVKALSQETRLTSDLNQMNLDLQKEINRRKQVEKQLSHDALHDALTGLANRIQLFNRLEHAIRIAGRNPRQGFSILYIDLDNFKTINDSLGHATGDQALVACSQIFKRTVRATDTIARIGGEEFIILLESVDTRSDAITVAERILDEIKAPVDLNGNLVRISCSIGILEDAERYTNIEEILRNADLAMYQAKLAGKARYVRFQNEMRTS